MRLVLPTRDILNNYNNGIFLPTKFTNDNTKPQIYYDFRDDITQLPENGQGRFAFQNARSILCDPSEPATDILDVIALYDIDHMGVAEPNCTINDNFEVAVNAQARKSFGNGVMAGGSIKKSKLGYKPGEIMQITRGKLLGRQGKRAVDKLGRFSWRTFRGKNKHKLIVITAYRVCQSKGTKPATPDCNSFYW